ncbi:helix-turn-helix transcriptional regulator [Micromonospora sp. NPDC047738]|uniref:helix-turn-helix transcriptional regulator n=1 Tax=unclassified Micromonospora TaxID=2617518 RepID=UPI0033C0C412
MDLDEELRGLYALTLRMPGAGRDELAFALGGDQAQVADGLRRLAALGLVGEVDGRVEAVPPGAGLGRLLRDGLDGVSRRLADVERLVAELEPLSREYAAGQRVVADASVSLVSGVGEARDVPLAVALTNPPVRSYCCQKDPRSFDGAVVPWMEDLLHAARERLLVMSLLVEAEVLESPAASGTLTRFAAAGIEVRVRGRLPSGYYVMGEHAALPLKWGDDLAGSAYQFHLVRSAVLVAALTSLFEELWRTAVPLGAANDPHRRVVALLAQGLTDDAIARRLGLSVRTVRARVARVMAELGVRTRFQAGVVAARSGWLD